MPSAEPETSGASDLWDFALAFYAFPGVADACLRLQDEGGADVDMLIFALWQASNGVALPAERFAEIEAATRDWRDEVVRKLRSIRRHLKPAGGELREMVKSAELEAERQQLQSLAAFAETSATPLTASVAARTNLVAYQASAGLELPDGPIEGLLAAFLRALGSGFAV